MLFGTRSDYLKKLRSKSYHVNYWNPKTFKNLQNANDLRIFDLIIDPKRAYQVLFKGRKTQKPFKINLLDVVTNFEEAKDTILDKPQKKNSCRLELLNLLFKQFEEIRELEGKYPYNSETSFSKKITSYGHQWSADYTSLIEEFLSLLKFSLPPDQYLLVTSITLQGDQISAFTTVDFTSK